MSSSYFRSLGGDFRGLGLNIPDYRDAALIDDSPYAAQFWNSVGNFKPRLVEGGLNGTHGI